MTLRRTVSAALVVLVLLGAVLVAKRRGPHGQGPLFAEPPDLHALRQQGNALHNAGKSQAALELYERGYQEAQRQQNRKSTLRFLNNLGSANYALSRYREAAKAFLEARSLAELEGDLETFAAASNNLSSMYSLMGELDAAIEAARRGLEVPVEASAKNRDKLLIQAALLETRQNHCERAIEFAREAIEWSRSQHKTAEEAQGWNELGNTMLECKQLANAEEAMQESFRLRKETRDDQLRFSYESLAALRMAQNNPAEALKFSNLAVRAATPAGAAAVWRPLFERGKAHLALSHWAEAYRDFAASVRKLQEWRSEILPGDAFRVGAEADAHEVYAALIALAGRLHEKTSQIRYAFDSFAVAEDGRAASLRALWAESDLPHQLPESYWLTLAELKKAELAQAAPNAGIAAESVTRQLRARLAEMEMTAGLQLPAAMLENDSGEKLLRATRDSLGADAVYLGFHTGPEQSWLWAVTRQSIEFRRLPGEKDLNGEIAQFVAALREKSPAAGELGQKLRQRLFGTVSVAAIEKKTWVVAADGPLYELPFAALREKTRDHRVQYVLEGHAIRNVPGVMALFRTRPQSKFAETFVGLGDAIYNPADTRLPRSKAWGLPKKDVPGELRLARLMGSGRELDGCANLWRSNGVGAELLKGVDANTRKLTQALRQRPAVLHVAAHMVFPAHEAGSGSIVLSLQEGNRLELLNESQTAGLRSEIGLVVLNGCSTGKAEVLPGAGLMGMTRAWLAAGARAVITTHWPAPDQESGNLFLSLYQRYFASARDGRRTFGELLREAQLAELRAGADPARWASYFCVETN